MRVRCDRTEMIGGGTSYNFRVPIEDNPRSTTGIVCIIRDNDDKPKEYVNLLHILTWTDELTAMQAGFPRYIEIVKREKQALRGEMIKFARTIFPELEDYAWLSEYWYNFTLPSKQVWTDVDLSDFESETYYQNAKALKV